MVSDYQFSADWFTGNIEHWLETFRIVGKDFNKPAAILEIGSYEGRSACWIAENLLNPKDSYLHCIDTFKGSVEHTDLQVDLLTRFTDNIHKTPNAKKIFTFQGDSKKVLVNKLKKKAKYDFIYVDGSHMSIDVIIDGFLSYHLLEDDGVIIFDDYGWKHNNVETVKQALNVLEDMLPIRPILSGWQRSYVKKQRLENLNG